VGVRRRKPAVEASPRPKPARRRRPKASVSPIEDRSGEDATQFGTASLHDLFQQQVRSMLDRTGLDEEQKQSVLIAASCPCCGAGGLSFTARLKPRG
jgi:hypothetical protein